MCKFVRVQGAMETVVETVEGEKVGTGGGGEGCVVGSLEAGSITRSHAQSAPKMSYSTTPLEE